MSQDADASRAAGRTPQGRGRGPMTILHLSSHLNVGGVTSSILSLIRGLTPRGHSCAVASGGGQLAAQVEAAGAAHWELPLHTSAEFSPQVFSAARRLIRRLQEHPVDLIHAHTRVGQVVADRLSRALGIPYVATWHGFFRPRLGRRLWPCTGQLTIAISEPVREHLLRAFHVPASRIRLIPHGIDPAPFEQPIEAALQEQLRQRCGLAPEGPVIGTIARLVASKGVDQLIRLLADVRAGIPGARLLLVGDGEERARLERLARERHVEAAVHFAGALPETRVALSLMDVFVFLPAEQEGFGLSLLEAMASGRPIVAVRRGGGAPWVLERSGAGTLVEPGDEPALAQAITRLLQDPEAAAASGAKARVAVKEQFALGRMLDAVEAVYQELVIRAPLQTPPFRAGTKPNRGIMSAWRSDIGREVTRGTGSCTTSCGSRSTGGGFCRAK